MYCTDSRAFSLYGNRLSKFRTQVKNTLIGVPVDDIIETSNHLVRECLRHNIVPFIIDERHKQFYYRGLREFATTRGYLLDTCFSAQDTYVAWVKYFYPGLLD